ncbi:hypothetical protein MAR_030525 [Mya arenaria]|uniref:Uncharacterized protein n=1 Tax=Mya arenaria TaxID=6604 RepID=A0ABY7F4F0_MYAAR|nr:hypothetical protein MAR_030525 [Mya arenaria]
MEIKAQTVFLKIVLFVSFGFYLCGGTRCDSNCTDCDTSESSGSCRNCRDGFYPSHSYCLGNECKRENGVCLNGCRDGYFGTICDQECSKRCRNNSGVICNIDGACLGGCVEGYFGKRCKSDGRYQQTEETNSGSVIGGAVGGVLGVKESKETYEDISPGRSQDEPYTTLASASTTEYEIHDSEPRSELTIEGEDNRVYYNDERVYYKNVGGNVHKT